MIYKQKIQQAANNYIGHEPEIDEGVTPSFCRAAICSFVNPCFVINSKLFNKAMKTFCSTKYHLYICIKKVRNE